MWPTLFVISSHVNVLFRVVCYCCNLLSESLVRSCHAKTVSCQACSCQVKSVYVWMFGFHVVNKLYLGSSLRWLSVDIRYIQWWHRPAQFSLNSICAIKPTISLEIKCPQLNKSEVRAARNQNSIGDRTEKKPWEKPGSVGGPFLLWPDETSCLFQLQQSQIVRAQLVPVAFSQWLSRWWGPHWGSVSGAHLGFLSPLMFRAVEVVSRCWSTIWSEYRLDLVTAVTIWAGYGLDWVATVTSK